MVLRTKAEKILLFFQQMVSRRSNDFLRPTISRVKLFLLSRYLILGSWDRISLVLPCHLEAACHNIGYDFF